MKYFLIITILLQALLFGVEGDNISTTNQTKSDEPIEIKDTSGLSDDQLREIAKDSDESKKEKISIKEVFEATDSNGSVDISKIESAWEDLSPTPKKYDWIQTKSGEWFKGKIEAMYNDRLEFDSDEVGLYVFKFKNITQIKSYNIISVNIDGVATFSGILRFKDAKMTIIQGDNKFVFPKSLIVSLAPTAQQEYNYWSGKITISLDQRSGNKEQFDYSAKFNIKRRSDKTRLSLDYLGRISTLDNKETANDHRISEKFDIYLSRNFFWTPVFSEYFQDKFQNIENQITAGIGIGYTIINTKTVELDISGGPAVMYTQYTTTSVNVADRPISPTLELSTILDVELNKMSDLKYSYKLTYTDEKSGTYKHHMILTLENELTKWLDLDISAIWDYIEKPEQRADLTTPDSNDYQFLVGLGVEF